MANPIDSTIGTGGIYSLPQTWEDACPVNLVTDDKVWRGLLKNQEFVFAGTALTIAGTTVDATHYVELTTEAGASFVDHANKATNPLRYDASKGAAIRITAEYAQGIIIQQDYTRISKLQVSVTATGANASAAVVTVGASTANCDIDNCILESFEGGAFGTVSLAGTGHRIRNSLIVQKRAPGTNIRIASLTNGASAYNTTFVALGGTLDYGIATQYAAGVLKNCYVGGVTAPENGVGTLNKTNCYSSAAAAGYSVAPLSTATFADVTVGTHNLRKVAGSLLIDAGVNDPVNSPYGILGFPQAGASRDVGADEFPAAPTPVSFTGPVPTRNGAVGSAASFSNAGFFAGSATPFTYTLQAGVLPAGLTLNAATGIINGVPTAAGTQSGIVIRATDSNGATADTNAYSIVIAASNAAPTFPGTIANITGTGGTAITPVNVSGQFSDTDALTYSVSPAGTAWPAGLVISSAGVISGTVATSTTNGLKVRATDTAGQTVDSNTFNAVLSAPASGTFTTDEMESSGTLRVSQAFTWTWFVGGLNGTRTSGSGTTTAGGKGVVPGLPLGSGEIMVKFADGGVFYQPGTVA